MFVKGLRKVQQSSQAAASAGGQKRGSKKRSRSSTELVIHTAEFSVFLELLLIAFPSLYSHVRGQWNPRA